MSLFRFIHLRCIFLCSTDGQMRRTRLLLRLVPGNCKQCHSPIAIHLRHQTARRLRPAGLRSQPPHRVLLSRGVGKNLWQVCRNPTCFVSSSFQGVIVLGLSLIYGIIWLQFIDLGSARFGRRNRMFGWRLWISVKGCYHLLDGLSCTCFVCCCCIFFWGILSAGRDLMIHDMLHSITDKMS